MGHGTPRTATGPPRPLLPCAAAPMKRLLPTALLVLLLVPAGALAAADRGAWPHINGKLVIDHGPPGSHRIMHGDANRHNELLGGYGNDTIYGGNAGDVIWADYHPSGQPASQHVTIYAGNGRNFIYASHGENTIYTGSGPTFVLAHFGRGTIVCGSAAVRVTLGAAVRSRYHLQGCRHVSYD
jgi:RTX calcium-binding nonapeptide repeat (4 copies)